MNDMFNDLCNFFGLNEMPVNLGELLPWLFSVMLAVCLVMYVFGMISQLVRSLDR